MSWLQRFHVDALAGFAVAIVALPLALGFAVTTGTSPAAGIATAVIAGLIAAVVGGSEYQVSGPTGAMTVVLAPIVAQHGVAALAPVGAVAGLLMILAAAFRAGRWMERVPWSILEGFTLGIALTIALQQLPLILATPKGTGTEALLVAYRTIKQTNWNSTTFVSILIVAITLVVKFSWRAYAEQKHFRIHIPGSIMAVTASTLLVWALSLDIPKVGSIKVEQLFHFDLSFSSITTSPLLVAAFSVALLGGIESLLSARMADAMVHRRDGFLPSKHRPDRELVGQGLGTIAASLLGGMPATGAIARTSVNVHAGARTRWASAIHAIAILVFVVFLSALVQQIPMAALAGVLLGTSFRIASPSSVREALRTTRLERVSLLVTAVAVLAIDLIWGILIGILIHLMMTRMEKKVISPKK